MLDKCSETCGWIAGIIAALSFGTFGVPIKSTKGRIKVDPLVMQSYKSLLCFVTCWLVIPLGEPFKFSPWGIVSGIFWVPGATAGIYGIQNAGLAVSVGTWSSLIVMSSFCWGILVFNESVKNKFHALIASIILIIGLIGMSVYSEPVQDTNTKVNMELISSISGITSFESENDENLDLISEGSSCKYSSDEEENGDVELIPLVKTIGLKSDKIKTSRKDQNQEIITSSNLVQPTEGQIGEKIKKRRKINNRQLGSTELKVSKQNVNNKLDIKEEELVHFFGKFALTKRQLGLIGAIVNGVWGSNNMIPMHYARAQGFYGAGYLISYSVGSMIVTVFLWFIRYLINLYIYDDYHKAYNALPSFHVSTLIGPGSLAGFLYSLGNFCSIIAVTTLGQGVGYSFVQTSMLFSGLWGIFYFGEVQGTDRIFKWMISSIVTLVGILTLSYEHEGSSGH